MRRLAVAFVNCIIVFVVAVAVIFYVRINGQNTLMANEQSFQDTTIILEEIASNYLEDSQKVCDLWASYLKDNPMSMEEAVSYLKQASVSEDTSAQIIWKEDMTGLASDGKAANPSDNSLDYSKDKLKVLFEDLGTDKEINITPRYSDPLTGAYVVAFYNEVTLYEEGQTKEAILLYVVPVSLLEEHWTFPTEYGDEEAVALIDQDGSYVIKPSNMKNEDFFSYIYSYNQGSIDADELKKGMKEETTGLFTALNAEKENCYVAYAHLDKNDEWLLVSMIPASALGGGEIDWTIPTIILIALLCILAIDIGYINLVRLREKEGSKKLAEAYTEQEQQLGKIREQSVIINALSRDYLNVFCAFPEEDRAEILKLDGYVTEDINKGAEGSSAYSAILQNYIRDRVHPEDKETFWEQLKVEHILALFKKEEKLDYTYRILLGDEVHYFEAHYVKFSTGDEPLQLVVGFRNIDDLVADQKERQRVLEEALNAAQHANRSKTTFLNNMSHDIRTPMNAIIGFTSLAATHTDDPERIKEYLNKIQISSSHLLSLINDVLDMSRIESGKVKIEEKEVHLPDVLHDLRTIVQADIKAKSLDFFIDVMDMENEDVICDKLRLSQILLNILSNAMKFTKPGGQISMKVQQSPDTDPEYADYTFRIKDTGIGMSPEFVKHIFEPFEREETATVSGIQGSGLGMAITKNIVDMMDGSIEVISQLGQGSEFIVDLRFKKNKKEISREPIPELVGAAALVVDDDMDCCISVCKMLSDIGMRPEWTSSGKEAIVRTQYAYDRKDPFAAYIIDWLMPDMNGIETVRRIRRIIGDDKPIIILTAYDWGEIEAEAKEAGVTHFIAKPIFMSELREILSKPYEAMVGNTPETAETDFEGKKILLVEDNELNQEIADEILTEAGFEVTIAGDGAVAVDMMKQAAPGQFALILMDIQMPVMNGYEATKAIRSMENPALAGIPIIAMTANAFEQDRHLAEEAGMSGYVPKPIDIDKLMETLKEFLV